MPIAGIALVNRWLCLATALVIVGLLFYLGGKPVAVGLFPEPWDKLAHFAVFGTVTGLLWIGLGRRLGLLVIVLIAAIGALDEWHQAGLPGRSADYRDFLTDVGAAIFVVFVLQRRWP